MSNPYRALPPSARFVMLIITLVLIIGMGVFLWRIIASSNELWEEELFSSNCPNGVVILYLSDGDVAFVDASETQTLVAIIGKPKTAIMQACRDKAYWVATGTSILYARLGLSMYEGPHAADRPLTQK